MRRRCNHVNTALMYCVFGKGEHAGMLVYQVDCGRVYHAIGKTGEWIEGPLPKEYANDILSCRQRKDIN